VWINLWKAVENSTIPVYIKQVIGEKLGIKGESQVRRAWLSSGGEIFACETVVKIV